MPNDCEYLNLQNGTCKPADAFGLMHAGSVNCAMMLHVLGDIDPDRCPKYSCRSPTRKEIYEAYAREHPINFETECPCCNEKIKIAQDTQDPSIIYLWAVKDTVKVNSWNAPEALEQ